MQHLFHACRHQRSPQKTRTKIPIYTTDIFAARLRESNAPAPAERLECLRACVCVPVSSVSQLSDIFRVLSLGSPRARESHSHNTFYICSLRAHRVRIVLLLLLLSCTACLCVCSVRPPTECWRVCFSSNSTTHTYTRSIITRYFNRWHNRFAVGTSGFDWRIPKPALAQQSSRRRHQGRCIAICVQRARVCAWFLCSAWLWCNRNPVFAWLDARSLRQFAASRHKNGKRPRHTRAFTI